MVWLPSERIMRLNLKHKWRRLICWIGWVHCHHNYLPDCYLKAILTEDMLLNPICCNKMQLWITHSPEMFIDQESADLIIPLILPFKMNAVALGGGRGFKPGYVAYLSASVDGCVLPERCGLPGNNLQLHGWALLSSDLCFPSSSGAVCPIHQVSRVGILLTMFQWIQVDSCLPIPSGSGTDATHMLGARERRRNQRRPAAVSPKSCWIILVYDGLRLVNEASPIF